MGFEGSAPLEWLGLVGSRLNLMLRWQDSTVVDPVTGERDLSPVDYRLTNGRHIGHRIVLSVSGSF